MGFRRPTKKPEEAGLAKAPSRLTSLTEVFGGIAVIVSLVFVGLEIRQNTAASRAATYQEMIRASNEYLLVIGTDPDLSLIMYRASNDSLRERLSGLDQLQYFNVRRVFWRNMENAYVQHQIGVLGDAEWDTYHGLACRGREIEIPEMWRTTINSLRGDFLALIDACP